MADNISAFYSTPNGTLQTAWHNSSFLTSNTTMGQANSSSADTALFVLKAIPICLIIFGAILGNSLVILSVARFRRLRTRTNFFIVSLAAADLLVASLVMWMSASMELAGGRWLFGRVACDIFNSNDVLFSTASILHLCCISVDRYIAITAPYQYRGRMSRRNVFLMIAATWLASALISYVPIQSQWYATAEQKLARSTEGPDVCTFTVRPIYAVISSSVSFWIPASIMVFTYARIYVAARSQEEKIVSMAKSSAGKSIGTPDSNFTSTAESPISPVKRFAATVSPSAVSTGRSTEKRPSTESLTRVATQDNSLDGVPLVPLHKTEHSASFGSDDALLGLEIRSPLPADKSGSHLDVPKNRTLRKISMDSTSVINQSSAAMYKCRTALGALLPLATARDQERHRKIKESRLLKREHKAAKTLGIVMGCFIVCWLPFFVWYLITFVGNVPNPPVVVSILFWIGYFNSCLNPMIYAQFNRDFRSSFKIILFMGRKSSFSSIDLPGRI